MLPSPAGLQREGAAEAELAAQLAAVRADEAQLPSQIEALQATLQAELDALTALESSVPRALTITLLRRPRCRQSLTRSRR